MRAKLGYVQDANHRLNDYLHALRWQDFAMPLDFDHFGRERGESSYIAVVHADGNGMGLLFRKALDAGNDNRTSLNAYRDLSEAVDKAGQNALDAVAEVLVDGANLAQEQGTQQWLLGAEEDKITLTKQDEEHKCYIPFRPLVYGGDDITFVCDGRLGITLAVLYLQEFEKAAQTITETVQEYMPTIAPLRACAGIAIVKTHYPFARAYALAEDLCQNAKKHVRELSAQVEVSDFSALDWHLATGGLYGEIDLIRNREYQTSDGNLHLRPIGLAGSPQQNEWQTWPAFKGVLENFSGDGWREKHNKVIRLRDALRQGPSTVRQFVTAFVPAGLPPLAGGDFAKSGWHNQQCGYFDAIEALDYYIPLNQRPRP